MNSAIAKRGILWLRIPSILSKFLENKVNCFLVKIVLKFFQKYQIGANHYLFYSLQLAIYCAYHLAPCQRQEMRTRAVDFKKSCASFFFRIHFNFFICISRWILEFIFSSIAFIVLKKGYRKHPFEHLYQDQHRRFKFFDDTFFMWLPHSFPLNTHSRY